jgi:N-methylhydantoinase A
LPALPESKGTPRPAATRAAIFDAEPLDTPVYRRDALGRGDRIAGPALIEESGAITLLPPAFTLAVHASGALLITRAEAA